jgi:hypothetical protein
MIFGALAAALLAGSADAETYICKMKPDAHDYGWISKIIVINVNDTGDKVLVNDALVQAAYDKPISATIVVNSDKRLTIKWDVKGLKNDRHQTIPRFMYRLTILKARGNKAIVKAQAAGYWGDLGASGKCRVSK